MIVCSCNVLTDGDVKACLGPGPGCPRTPAQVYRCLGCSPNCGRCARSIRAIMDDALLVAAREVCQLCPVNACLGHPEHAHDAREHEPHGHDHHGNEVHEHAFA